MSTAARAREQLQAARTAEQALYQLLDLLPENYDNESAEYANYTKAKGALTAVGEVVNDLSATAAAAD